MKKRPMKDEISLRVARGRKALERHRIANFIGGRGAVALALGAALSVGGVVDTLDNVHFLVQKDLDAVRVVRLKGDDVKVVADLKGNFTGNTVFKLAQILPDRFVSRELALFDQKWIATGEWLAADEAEDAVLFGLLTAAGHTCGE